MKKFTKIVLIIAAAFLIVGLCLSFVGFITGAGNGISLRDGHLVVNDDNNYTYEKSDITGITDINVNVSNSRIELVQSDSKYFTININMKYWNSTPEVTIEDGKISINASHFSPTFSVSTLMNLFDALENDNVITIGIPNDSKLSNITLETSNGNVTSNVELETETFDIDTKNGRIDVSNLTCTGEAKLETSNGKIDCEGVFSEDSEFKTSNGSVILSGTFKGDVDCKTSNGSIDFRANDDVSSYDVSAKTSNGSVYINNVDYDKSYTQDNNTGRDVILKTSNGKITARFK